jgi:hypothetical protein
VGWGASSGSPKKSSNEKEFGKKGRNNKIVVK